MKNKTPLKLWFEANRWNSETASKEIGLSPAAICLHLAGKAFPRTKAIAQYKRLGVPSEVIKEHIHWLVAAAGDDVA